MQQIRDWIGQHRLLTAVLVVAAVLIGWWLITPRYLSYANTSAGDCMQADPSVLSGASAGQVNVVPGGLRAGVKVGCGDPHQHEIMAHVEHPAARGEPYPGDALATYAADTCAKVFADYVGRPLEGSSLGATAYYPIRGDWEQKADRTIICIGVDPSQPAVTGSIKGSGR